jgi:hypothetical protein
MYGRVYPDGLEASDDDGDERKSGREAAWKRKTGRQSGEPVRNTPANGFGSRGSFGSRLMAMATVAVMVGDTGPTGSLGQARD